MRGSNREDLADLHGFCSCKSLLNRKHVVHIVSFVFYDLWLYNYVM